MEIHKIKFFVHKKEKRSFIQVFIETKEKRIGVGEIAPLAGWSCESLQDAYGQLNLFSSTLCAIDWKDPVEQLASFSLFPSVRFGLESALYNALDPCFKIKPYRTARLLMGSFEEILRRAKIAEEEKCSLVKVKFKGLVFDEAKRLIDTLHPKFRLRIDVNRSWKTQEALEFFSNYPLDHFDYIEEPFDNPKDLALFSHPLAVDESFPSDVTLFDLEKISCLKALIYKPTLQGGYLHCLPLIDWCQKKGVDLILSSSFENKRGLLEIAKMAQRLSLKAPLGIGTEDY